MSSFDIPKNNQSAVSDSKENPVSKVHTLYDNNTSLLPSLTFASHILIFAAKHELKNIDSRILK